MKYLNALNSIDGVGGKTLARLMSYFKNGENIWQASKFELEKSGISEKLAEKIISERKNIDPEKKWEIIEKENITIVPITSPQYPDLLKEIASPPYLLFAKGNIDLLQEKCISIVGSRSFTAYGKMATEKFSQEIASVGICIVSGLAFGIDALAHQGALTAGGKTIAVLGNSLDEKCISPKANLTLAREILNKNGLLVSEFSPEMPASKLTFPMRNRIIAGLSMATLVIEAAEKSGSLITANYALESNRDVYATPGSIFSPQSEGTNNLIKKGAKLVSNLSDILEETILEKKATPAVITSQNSLKGEEKEVFSLLSHEPAHIDRIIKLTKLETPLVISTLTMLEIKGVIKNIGGQNYIKL
jgi:DNA processing protein